MFLNGLSSEILKLVVKWIMSQAVSHSRKASHAADSSHVKPSLADPKGHQSLKIVAASEYEAVNQGIVARNSWEEKFAALEHARNTKKRK